MCGDIYNKKNSAPSLALFLFQVEDGDWTLAQGASSSPWENIHVTVGNRAIYPVKWGQPC